MSKIIGNTIATPMAIPDWNQTDEKKADYIKNKPTLGTLAEKDEVEKADLAQDVQASLGKADSALQSYIETDPTVPDWAKATTKPTYTASEVGLGNVDNTSDADKPVSAATQTVIDELRTELSESIDSKVDTDTLSDYYTKTETDNAVAQKSQVQIITWEDDD